MCNLHFIIIFLGVFKYGEVSHPDVSDENCSGVKVKAKPRNVFAAGLNLFCSEVLCLFSFQGFLEESVQLVEGNHVQVIV